MIVFDLCAKFDYWDHKWDISIQKLKVKKYVYNFHFLGIYIKISFAPTFAGKCAFSFEISHDALAIVVLDHEINHNT